MDERLLQAAHDAIGFMPEDEGLALYEAALAVAADGPLLEIGSYCGKSTIYLAAAARAAASTLFTIDHHRGSEEHQPGEEYHDERLVGPDGRIDTFPTFRKTIEEAGLERWVIPMVASSWVVFTGWTAPLSFLFIDGGHSDVAAKRDSLWAMWVRIGGLVAIHDVFEDPAEGGRPPFEIFTRLVEGDDFRLVGTQGSLRVLERVRNPGR
jgi:predicted O-methyltransferase YrrM